MVRVANSVAEPELVVRAAMPCTVEKKSSNFCVGVWRVGTVGVGRFDSFLCVRTEHKDFFLGEGFELKSEDKSKMAAP